LQQRRLEKLNYQFTPLACILHAASGYLGVVKWLKPHRSIHISGAHGTFQDWSTHQLRALCETRSVAWRFLQPFLERFCGRFQLTFGRFRPQKRSRNAHSNAHRNARETLGTTQVAAYGRIDQSWKVSWSPPLLLGSTASAPMAIQCIAWLYNV
jgi:hypothetical protein